jgi:hypothetical protein
MSMLLADRIGWDAGTVGSEEYSIFESVTAVNADRRWEPLFHQSLFVESDMAPLWWPQFLH